MGFFSRLFGRRNEAAETVARKTMNYLKIVERKDRRRLIQDENRDFETEYLLNRLEFSRRSCVLEYLARFAKGKDVDSATLSAIAA